MTVVRVDDWRPIPCRVSRSLRGGDLGLFRIRRHSRRSLFLLLAVILQEYGCQWARGIGCCLLLWCLSWILGRIALRMASPPRVARWGCPWLCLSDSAGLLFGFLRFALSWGQPRPCLDLRGGMIGTPIFNPLVSPLNVTKNLCEGEERGATMRKG